MNQAYQKLMVEAEAEAEEPAAAVPTQHFCWLLNESICDFTTNPANADQVIFLFPSPPPLNLNLSLQSYPLIARSRLICSLDSNRHYSIFSKFIRS